MTTTTTTPTVWAHACFECEAQILSINPNQSTYFCSAKCEKDYNDFFLACGCHPEDGCQC